MSTFLVLLIGAVIVASGLFTVTRRNPIHAALSMLIALAGVGALMLGLRSPFLATMQVLLYGGAIMVLFVFVIMLLTLREDELPPDPPLKQKLVAGLGTLLLLCAILFGLSKRPNVQFKRPHSETALAAAEAAGTQIPRAKRADFGSTEHFARFLYTDYVLAFELVTVLVMSAVAGVIVLARRPDRATLEATKITGANS